MPVSTSAGLEAIEEVVVVPRRRFSADQLLGQRCRARRGPSGRARPAASSTLPSLRRRCPRRAPRSGRRGGSVRAAAAADERGAELVQLEVVAREPARRAGSPRRRRRSGRRGPTPITPVISPSNGRLPAALEEPRARAARRGRSRRRGTRAAPPARSRAEVCSARSREVVRAAARRETPSSRSSARWTTRSG